MNKYFINILLYMNYQYKYSKYKNKYINLKNQIGGIPNKRIKHDIGNLKKKYSVNENENIITVNIMNIDFQLKIIFPENYAFNEPKIKLLNNDIKYPNIYYENYLFLNTIINWTVVNTIDDCINEFIELIKDYMKEITIPTHDTDLILVIGSNPNELRHGRTFYDLKNVHMIDNNDIFDDTYKDIYHQVDFNNKIQMCKFAKKFKNKFNIICFDYSVFKFIRQDGKTIKYLYKLLSDNGVLILVDPSSNNGGIIPLFKDISGNIISPKEEKYQLLKMDFYYKRLDITNKWFKDVNFKTEIYYSNKVNNDIFTDVVLKNIGFTKITKVLIAKK
jgi:ubiquitin-protein ligase